MYKRNCIMVALIVTLGQIAWAFTNYFAWCWLTNNVSWFSKCSGTEWMALAWAVTMSVMFIIVNTVQCYILMHAADN